MPATSKTTLTLHDKDNEASSVSVHAVALTAGNYTAQMGLADDFRDAVMAVVLGVLFKDTRVAIEAKFAPSLPTTNIAQRGIKWLVRCLDTNGNSVSFHIPTGDISDASGLLVEEKLDPTSAEFIALKAAVEAYVTSNDGEAVTLVEVVYLD